tara:strand:- start:1190 stop:1417 length:228 start_codon:yes stop_codon:yes gene_type:complete
MGGAGDDFGSTTRDDIVGDAFGMVVLVVSNNLRFTAYMLCDSAPLQKRETLRISLALQKKTSSTNDDGVGPNSAW